MGSVAHHEVVITDSVFPDATMEEERLSKINVKVKKLQTYNEEEIMKETRNAIVILCDYARISRKVISNLQRARAVIEYGVGYDNIDVKAATEKGLLVCNIPDFMTSEVAEHSLALILALTRRITWADRLAREGGWKTFGSLS